VMPRPPVRPLPLPRDESPFPSSGSGSLDESNEARAADASSEKVAPEAESAAGGAIRDGISAQSDMPRAPAKSARLGTGHGRSETSRVTYTSFERDSDAPAEVVTLRYDTRENLLAMGVIRDAPVYARPAPTPFPGQFVPDPR
jgi:hypothetical protein